MTDIADIYGSNHTLGEQCHDALVKTGQAKADAFEFERLFKLKRKYMFLGTKGTVAEREALAATHVEVMAAERKWIDAERSHILARAESDGLDKRFEEMRTMEATKRAEMGLR